MRRISSLLTGVLLAGALALPPAAAASPGDCAGNWYAWNSIQVPSGYWATGMHTIDWVNPAFDPAIEAAFDVSADAPIYPGQVTMTLLPPMEPGGQWFMVLLQQNGFVDFDGYGLQVINPAQRTDFMDLWWFSPSYITLEDARAVWSSPLAVTTLVIDGQETAMRHSPLMSSCMGGMGWTNVIGTDHLAVGAFHRSFGPKLGK